MSSEYADLNADENGNLQTPLSVFEHIRTQNQFAEVFAAFFQKTTKLEKAIFDVSSQRQRLIGFLYDKEEPTPAIMVLCDTGGFVELVIACNFFNLNDDPGAHKLHLRADSSTLFAPQLLVDLTMPEDRLVAQAGNVVLRDLEMSGLGIAGYEVGGNMLANN